MSWKNKRDFEAYRIRKSERGAKRGESLEAEVETLLSGMVERKIVSGFIHHEKNSTEDHDGKDFTVINNEGERASFGVTISMRSWNISKMRHMDTHQFCFPAGTRPETMEKRILGLFSSQ